MATLKTVSTTTTLSRQTVEATIDDALTFLRFVGKHPAVRAQLGAAGYTDAETERAFALVRSVIVSPAAPVVTENPVAMASAQIEAWRASGFALARSALAHLYPEQEAFLLEGLDVGNAATFIPTLSIFLERCDALESGKARTKATRKADHAALATLESRGFTKAERKRLSALLAIVLRHAAPMPDGEAPPTADHDARFLELRGWLLDWRNVAKVVIKRRDWLIALGIGKRRAKKAVAPALPASPAPPAHADEEHGPQSRAA